MLFVIILLQMVFARYCTWENPQNLLVACCLGVMGANLADVALGRKDLGSAVQAPAAIAGLIYFVPFKALFAGWGF